jgi:predicted transcriptional regulator
MRVLLPETGKRAERASHERLSDGVPMEVIVTEDVLTAYRSDPEFRAYFETKVDAEQCRIYRTDEPVPFFLGLIDDEVQIGISEDGRPRALLATAAPEVFDWAERTLEEYRSGAELVDDV